MGDVLRGALGRSRSGGSVCGGGRHAGRVEALPRALRDRVEDPIHTYRWDSSIARRGVDGVDGPQSDRSRRGLSAHLTPSDSRPRPVVTRGSSGRFSKPAESTRSVCQHGVPISMPMRSGLSGRSRTSVSVEWSHWEKATCDGSSTSMWSTIIGRGIIRDARISFLSAHRRSSV